MSDVNPYRPPVSRPEADAAGAGGFNAAARGVAGGRGCDWIVSAFELFKKQPGTWILVIIAYLVCSLLIALVPLIGSIANILLYTVFVAFVMLGCRQIESGAEFEVGSLFAQLKPSLNDLIIVGVLFMVAMMVILVPAVLIVGGAGIMAGLSGGIFQLAALGLTALLAALVVTAVSIPIYMAMWFAPALVVFHNVKPVDALKASFRACLNNMVPFLLYGIVLLVLGIVATIPFGLGWLVLGPVIVASVYTGYRDIFFQG